MEKPFLSLLYPSEEERDRHERHEAVPSISAEVCSEMGFDEILSLKNSSLSDYFTTSPEVIRYRQRTLADMARLPALGKTLSEALPILCDIEELRRLDTSGTLSGDSYLYSITEIELYISAVDVLSRGLSPVRDRVESPAFQRLSEVIFQLAESDYFKDLNEKLSELSRRVHEVRSITVGVNLDAQLRPCDAGILSVNAEPFKSGKVLDKILRMSFRNDAFTCIAPLAPFGKGQSDNRREALMSAFTSSIEEVQHRSEQIKKEKGQVVNYTTWPYITG